MSRKTYTPEQIIHKLREAEVLLSQGATVAEASKQIGVTLQTYYRWRKGYGGMRVRHRCGQSWGLRIYTPTLFSDGVAKSGTVTLTAICQ